MKAGPRKLSFWEALFCYLALFGTFLLAGATGGITSSPQQQSHVVESQSPPPTNLAIAQADLVAQEEMADWAFWAMLGGIFTMLGSFAALYFIRKTWLTTQETLEMERGRNALKMRAYVVVIPQGIEQDVGELRYRGQVEIHNIGKTPAHKVSARVWMKEGRFKDEGFETDPFNNLADRTLLPDAKMRQGTKNTGKLSDFAQKPGFIFVYGRIDYTDYLSNRRSTTFCHRYNKATLEVDVTELGPATEPKVLIRTAMARHHIHGNTAD